MQEMQVRSLEGDLPAGIFLGEEMAPHSSTSCLGNAMDRRAWQAVNEAARESDTTWQLNNNIVVS